MTARSASQFSLVTTIDSTHSQGPPAARSTVPAVLGACMPAGGRTHTRRLIHFDVMHIGLLPINLDHTHLVLAAGLAEQDLGCKS